VDYPGISASGPSTSCRTPEIQVRAFEGIESFITSLPSIRFSLYGLDHLLFAPNVIEQNINDVRFTHKNEWKVNMTEPDVVSDAALRAAESCPSPYILLPAHEQSREFYERVMRIPGARYAGCVIPPYVAGYGRDIALYLTYGRTRYPQFHGVDEAPFTKDARPKVKNGVLYLTNPRPELLNVIERVNPKIFHGVPYESFIVEFTDSGYRNQYCIMDQPTYTYVYRDQVFYSQATAPPEFKEAYREYQRNVNANTGLATIHGFTNGMGDVNRRIMEFLEPSLIKHPPRQEEDR
jgi:hypothetical protein